MAEQSTHVQIGSEAPNFKLKNEHNEHVSLWDQRGTPVVLMFYPYDWSGNCTTEMCAVRDDSADWADSGARVFGISRDSAYSHKAWKEHLGLQFSLLADLDGSVARAYGAWNESAGRADRVTFVIDPEGIVTYVVHNDAGHVRDTREALEAVRRMRQPVNR